MMPLTYAGYLHLDKILSAQQPKSADHDEMLFIVIHQTYELWFKEILHEMDYLAGAFLKNNQPRINHTLKRILTILKVLVHQIDILETMTPTEFLTFRDRLESASGFQSAQFREIEFLLGKKRKMMLKHFKDLPEAQGKLERRYQQPTLWDVFLKFLQLNRYDLPAEILNRDVTINYSANAAVQKILVKIYQSDAYISEICERLVDLDEGLQEWRYRHVKMVERTIGNKAGTGGSDGTGYLYSTLNQHFFPDLWAIRTELK